MCEIDWTAVAAWVQAIGSVAAIVAAIWIGERSSKQSRDLVERERRRQADIVASTVSMRFHIAGVELQKTSDHALAIATHVKSGQPAALTKEALSKLFVLEQPRTLSEMRSNVTLFDRDTGIIVNTALDVLEGYNPTISSAIAMYEFKGSQPKDLIELCELVSERTLYLKGICATAEERLESAHELDQDSAP